MSAPLSPKFEVELPAGGRMPMQSPEEVELWQKSAERYLDDYHLTKQNDLVLVGAILQQQITMFRAQRRLNGLEIAPDGSGTYIAANVDAEITDKYLKMLNTASTQVQTIEKSLGIDKVSREAGGQMTVTSYLRTLKKAAHERGIHISKRTLAFEAFVNDLRWRLRVFHNADVEDRSYHDLTPEKILKWCEGQLQELEEIDKKFAREKGKVFIGQL